jgi:hypothetical protein
MAHPDTVLASAADGSYGTQLLNLVGSVKRNSDLFERIVVFDLGLTPVQRFLLDRIEGVELRTVPPFVPHWAQCWTWKPWIWTHVEARRVLYLDAGLTVLRGLAEPLEQIERRGYFVVGTGHPNGEHIPSDYYELYGLPERIAGEDCVGANVIGFDTGSSFYEQVIVPTFDDVSLGRNLGWSTGELSWRNVGINELEHPVIRDAPRFRHDQTLLNIHLYKNLRQPWVNPTAPYAASVSDREHPAQLMWAHRKRAGFPYVARLPYRTRGAALVGRALGSGLQLRSWLAVNGRSPHAYADKLAAVARRRRSDVLRAP